MFNCCQTRTVFKVKIAGCLRRPQPHGVDNIVSVARNRGVIWQSQHHLPVPSQEEKDKHVITENIFVLFFIIIYFKSYFHLSVNPFGTIGVMLGPAIEVHRTHVLRTSLLPGVAKTQPIISLLNLNNGINLY